MSVLSHMLVPGKTEYEKVVHAWTIQCKELLCADRCTLYLYDESNNQLTAYFADEIDSSEGQVRTRVRV